MRDLSSDILVKTHSMPVFEDLFPAYHSEDVVEPLVDINVMDTAIILHSSGMLRVVYLGLTSYLLNTLIGTTAFPKPIYLSHRVMVDAASAFCKYGCPSSITLS